MINGVINIYKEKGFTSHDVVAKLRGILHQKKIGHTGTLDPDAQGVLPVCLGRATKLCDMLTDKSKIYEAEVLLGTVTDTQDSTGTVLSQQEVHVTEDEIRSVLASFEGEQMQIPPMYSALKVNGKRLYELAREGIEVERKARKVHFYEITLLEVNLPRFKVRVHCSKGTYIRTLCYDVGEKLNCGACMDSLLRTKVERFCLADSYKLGQVEELMHAGRIMDAVTPIDQMFSEYAAVQVPAELERMIYNGNRFLAALLKEEAASSRTQGWYRVYDSGSRFQGIYEYRAEEDMFLPVKMFLEQ